MVNEMPSFRFVFLPMKRTSALPRSLFRWFVVVCWLMMSCHSFTAGAAPKPPTDKDRMDAVVRFAETILEHGRDTYGEKHTPLFPDNLEVDTLRAPEQMYIHRLGGPGPRSKQSFQPVISSNLAYQGNLMRFLVGLSNLTGNPKYKEAYKDCLRYYFEHYSTPNGLLQMGHHRWVNLNTDHWDGNDWPPGRSGHEMKRDYPYYPIFWETDPEAARRMLAAHWSSHIQDWGFMNFTRHGSYVRELNEEVLWNHPRTKPVVGIVKGNLTFFDSGSDIIWAGAQLGLLNNDDRPLYWAQRLYARYSDSAHPATGLPPWHHTSMRTFGTEDESLPEYALLTRGSLGLLGNGGVAMLRIGDDLGDKGKYYRETMVRHLNAFAEYGYDPENNRLRNLLFDGTDLAEREKQKDAKAGTPHTPSWHSWSPDPPTILAYAICYRQSNDGEIWETLRAMCRGNDLGDIGEAEGRVPRLDLATKQSDTLLIFPLVEIFRATGNKAYLELCRAIANNAVTQHFRAEKGLFTPSELHRTANLCSAEPLALLTLEAALRGKLDQVPAYAASNEGEAVPYLRPLKSRPYRPRVSHLAYSYSVKAMCDDLLPKSSGDRSVPVMSWQNVRKATDEAIVTFPDIAAAPITIDGMVDHPETRNSVSGMVVESPQSHTFSGNLNGTGDLVFTAARGEHSWAEGSTWTTTAWSPAETYDLVMNIAKGAKLAFHGHVLEAQGMAKWSSHRGAGIIKNGDGTAVLTADNTPHYNAELNNNRSYRAPTEINAGLLLVNNTTGSGVSPRSTVRVKHGGTLGGSGAIGIGGSSALVEVHAGGKITPGDGIGTLTLRDGLTLHDGARLEFECGGENDSFDLLRITGGTFRGAGKDGIVITIKDAGAIARGKSYDIIDWSGASYVDVDLNDFRLDKSRNWQGSFHLVGTKLRFSVFAPRVPPETPIPMPPAPSAEVPKPEPFATGHPPRPVTHFTWRNPKGGNWTDNANWKGGKIPNTKEPEWVQYRFGKPRAVSGVQVYWFDDGGGRRVPESWRVLYQEAGKWKPVEALDDYSLEKDAFNEVRFQPVETDSLKLEVNLRPGVSAGVQEWRVIPGG